MIPGFLPNLPTSSISKLLYALYPSAAVLEAVMVLSLSDFLHTCDCNVVGVFLSNHPENGPASSGHGHACMIVTGDLVLLV